MKRNLDRYEPQILERLAEAFDQLHTAAYPHMASSPAGGSRGNGAQHPLDQQEADRIHQAIQEAEAEGKTYRPWVPDASRSHLRKRLDALLQKARRLAEEIESTAQGTPDQRPPRIRCWNCGEYLKDRAKFCADCGKPRTGKPLPEHPPQTQPKQAAPPITSGKSCCQDVGLNR